MHACANMYETYPLVHTYSPVFTLKSELCASSLLATYTYIGVALRRAFLCSLPQTIRICAPFYSRLPPSRAHRHYIFSFLPFFLCAFIENSYWYKYTIPSSNIKCIIVFSPLQNSNLYI